MQGAHDGPVPVSVSSEIGPLDAGPLAAGAFRGLMAASNLVCREVKLPVCAYP